MVISVKGNTARPAGGKPGMEMEKMTMKTQKKVNGMTAAEIIAAKSGETQGGDLVSTGKHGEEIVWNYRVTDDLGRVCVCEPDNADCICVLNAGGIDVPTKSFGDILYRIAI